MDGNQSEGRSTGTWPQWLAVARREHHAGGGAVLDVLLRHWHADPADLLAQLETATGVPGLEAPADWGPVFDQLTVQQARDARCVMLVNASSRRVIAAADPWDEGTRRKLRQIPGPPLQLHASRAHDLAHWLAHAAAAPPARAALSPQAQASQGGGPIVSFVDSALSRAVTIGASDVHFECDRQGITVKHRLDGVLQRFARMEGTASAQEVISRIKVLAQLDITERRLPQDGRFRFEDSGARIDLRVSIMPSVHGEDAVLRLLDKAQWRQESRMSLDALGFDERRRALIRSIAMEPSGMLLVTGPTVSGKTTTLYAVLSEINTGLEKTITIEDPVEYELEGVLQIPVNERKGLTFAKGLRSVLRHDPDRILVGEIRDAETADIAVQASLTGHQVFTTVHANSVTDIMGRFRHFELDMFGLMSSLNGVVVQRLLRNLCPHCRQAHEALPPVRVMFESCGAMVPETLWRAVGCEHCRQSGYTGRFVLAEVQAMDDEFRDLVTSGAPLGMLKEHGRKRRVESLQQAGLAKAAEGVTSMEELQRVLGSIKPN